MATFFSRRQGLLRDVRRGARRHAPLSDVYFSKEFLRPVRVATLTVELLDTFYFDLADPLRFEAGDAEGLVDTPEGQLAPVEVHRGYRLFLNPLVLQGTEVLQNVWDGTMITFSGTSLDSLATSRRLFQETVQISRGDNVQALAAELLMDGEPVPTHTFADNIETSKYGVIAATGGWSGAQNLRIGPTLRSDEHPTEYTVQIYRTRASQRPDVDAAKRLGAR
jgi:hypothetical protein